MQKKEKETDQSIKPILFVIDTVTEAEVSMKPEGAGDDEKGTIPSTRLADE